MSLAETILASCILGLVVLAIFNLLPGSLLAMRQAEHQIRAQQLAQELLEKTRERPFEELLVGRPTPQPLPEDAAGVTFTPALEIYQIPATDPDLIKRIRVTVDWRFRGMTRQVSQETYRVYVRRP